MKVYISVDLEGAARTLRLQHDDVHTTFRGMLAIVKLGGTAL